MTPVATAVWIDIDAAETDAQPIAVECPTCYAIVRTRRLDDHVKAVHTA